MSNDEIDHWEGVPESTCKLYVESGMNDWSKLLIMHYIHTGGM